MDAYWFRPGAFERYLSRGPEDRKRVRGARFKQRQWRVTYLRNQLEKVLEETSRDLALRYWQAMQQAQKWGINLHDVMDWGYYRLSVKSMADREFENLTGTQLPLYP